MARLGRVVGIDARARLRRGASGPRDRDDPRQRRDHDRIARSSGSPGRWAGSSPSEWEAFRDVVPADERDGNLAAAYARMLREPRRRRCASAPRWPGACGRTPTSRRSPATSTTSATTTHGSDCASLVSSPTTGPTLRSSRRASCSRDATRLAGIPGVLITGRLDISGPPDIAWELAQALARRRARASSTTQVMVSGTARPRKRDRRRDDALRPSHPTEVRRPGPRDRPVGQRPATARCAHDRHRRR